MPTVALGAAAKLIHNFQSKKCLGCELCVVIMQHVVGYFVDTAQRAQNITRR